MTYGKCTCQSQDSSDAALVVDLDSSDEDPQPEHVASSSEEDAVLDDVLSIGSSKDMDMFDRRLSNKVVLANVDFACSHYLDAVEGALCWKFCAGDIEDLKDGPASVEDLLDWPSRFVESLPADEVSRLFANLSVLDIMTHYSGLDTPVYAVNCLSAFLNIHTHSHICSWEEENGCIEVICDR